MSITISKALVSHWLRKASSEVLRKHYLWLLKDELNLLLFNSSLVCLDILF